MYVLSKYISEQWSALDRLGSICENQKYVETEPCNYDFSSWESYNYRLFVKDLIPWVFPRSGSTQSFVLPPGIRTHVLLIGSKALLPKN
jgi:hypothetical protein